MVRPTPAGAPRTVVKQARMTPIEGESFNLKRDRRGFGSDSEYIRALVRDDVDPEDRDDE